MVISGTNLADATAVKFGTATVTYANFGSDSINQIVLSPVGKGTVNVTVTTAGGVSKTSSADKFTYLAAAAGSRCPWPHQPRRQRSRPPGADGPVEPEWCD